MWEFTLNKLTDETAERAVLRWCDKPNNITLISNAINCVYRFECGNTAYFLRMTHEKIRSLSAVRSVLDFQEDLYRLDVPICRTVRSINNALIESIEQDDLVFIAHVCEEVPGKEMHFKHKDFTVFANWGKALANLHKASSNYRPPPDSSFLSWKDLGKETDKHVSSEKQEVQNIYHNIKKWLDSQTVTNDNFGLIHGDMREANVICDGNRIHFIDFDEPVYHWWTQDIARAFLNIASQDIKLWEKSFNHFISGYRSVKQLTNEQLQQIPWLIKNKTMEMYLWTKNNWQDPIAPGGGSTENWLNEMHHNILNPNWLKELDGLCQQKLSK